MQRKGGHGEVRVRRAMQADAPEILRVHVASIRTLCARDYEPGEIDAWTRWKTEENYVAPIRTSDFYVAERRDSDGWRIVGFGSLSVPRAEITGLYFHPEGTGIGAGRAMMEHLLALARAAGLGELVVCSTRTAESFYARMGFVRVEDTFHEFPGGKRVASVRMRRREERPLPARRGG